MSGIFEELKKILINDNLSYRILTLSDGDLFDSQLISQNALKFYNELNGKFKINSQSIRFFSTNYANPDTLGLSSVIQFNTICEAKLLDINANDNELLVAEQLSKLYINDGLGNKISLLSDKNNIQSSPWDEKINEVWLFPGRNIFWIDDISQFSIKINEEEPVKLNIIEDEEINSQNYGII